MPDKLARARRWCRRALITNQTACKPGSVWHTANRARDGHSSATPVARRLKQPTRTATRTRVGAHAPLPSLFGLAPGGVCRAAAVAGSAVRSYRTVSPLPRPTRNAPRRSALCGTVPGVAPAGRYPAPSLHGARTFLPGPESGAAARPADPPFLWPAACCGVKREGAPARSAGMPLIPAAALRGPPRAPGPIDAGSSAQGDGRRGHCKGQYGGKGSTAQRHGGLSTGYRLIRTEMGFSCIGVKDNDQPMAFHDGPHHLKHSWI